MTENDSLAAPPKKLKLTLKLNNSSSSSTTSPIQSNSTTAVTTPIQSTAASPVKAEMGVGGLGELSSGLGNLKGRGRPKKEQETDSSVTDITKNNSTSSSNNQNNTSSTTSTNNTPNIPSSNPDYALDLKSFVSSMKTFKPRTWSLTRPITLNDKNVSGYDLNLKCGLWCTNSENASSAHLAALIANDKTTSVNNNSAGVDTVFEATCQCGKVFNDRSKYRKHSKIHDKPGESKSKTPPATPNNNNNNNSSSATSTPALSLKIKLNTKQQV